ncbi:TIGR03564 family F420-dependent LLM class oxidoreductase [Nonomuraea sp. KC401]|uniref:TIGR03564 family F420-dependent LLM class oxidoreductase n=1 Tax=unclassified Nonomuraea TaxID=2593643 RepID=UPI0010FE3C44|nr:MULTISPECIES: TIGR03564 family F420-dependent LLM class oxidoreductase [unclassified Nonomuraea]NBE97094.1 TIGR03564 family F420-dependent LLM class oxidoreductase [Nonomuraea sp. K271]TLF66156.1 TIGR03564 family F420-dependent LLM class oxidoreductase [Nonomuraea sp. KC401]
MGPSLDTVIEQCRAAATAGFAGVWLGQRTGRDALTTLAVAGRQAPGIELGTTAVPTYPRHPLALAAQALTVQEAVSGRLSLGVGVSHQHIIEDQYGYSFDRPARHLREYLSALVPLLRGESVTYQGETLKAVGAVDIPAAARPSVLVAALGPAMLRVAGELSDGAITLWATAASLADHVVPAITRAAGRGHPRVIASTFVCVTSDQDARRAWVNEHFGMAGQLPAYRAMLDRGHAAGPQDTVVIGDETVVERQIRQLSDAGATDLLAMLLGPEEEQARTTQLLADLAAG